MSNHELEVALEYLRKADLRITNQRLLILEYLINSHSHPTAEAIHHDLKSTDFNLSLATVYNTLELFIAHNLIVSLKGTDEKQHFDYFAHPHYHVVCTNCGRIEDVFDFSFTPLELDAEKQTNFHITQTKVEVLGLCPKCQKLQQKSHPQV